MIKEIGKRDLAWGVVSTFMKIGTGVLLFPFVLNRLTADQTGIWTIFTTIQMLVTLLDFGFNDSFARNIGYVFSGVHSLKTRGFERVERAVEDSLVDWKLLKSVIWSMKRFYAIISVALFVLLATAGTWYISTLTAKFSGSVAELWTSWVLLVVFMCWNLYSMYYQALLQGKGLSEQFSKIVIVSNATYLVLAIVLVYAGWGLVAVVGAQFLSIVIMRLLCRRVFYSAAVRDALDGVSADRAQGREVFRTIAPNAIKVGLTGLGGIIINRAGTFVGSEFLSLADMAMFGITLQLIVVVGRASTVVTRVFLPKLFEWRVTNNTAKIRQLYLRSSIVILAGYALAGLAIELLGNWALVDILGSNTRLLSGTVFWIMLAQSFLEANHVNAADFLLSKNEVPFFRASLISAGATLALLVLFVIVLDWGLLGMALAPALAQAAYQNWKWPLVVCRELRASK